MFSLQLSASRTRMEGVTDENPILLPLPMNATALDFDNLLVYLYKGQRYVLFLDLGGESEIYLGPFSLQ